MATDRDRGCPTVTSRCPTVTAGIGRAGFRPGWNRRRCRQWLARGVAAGDVAAAGRVAPGVDSEGPARGPATGRVAGRSRGARGRDRSP